MKVREHQRIAKSKQARVGHKVINKDGQDAQDKDGNQLFHPVYPVHPCFILLGFDLDVTGEFIEEYNRRHP